MAFTKITLEAGEIVVMVHEWVVKKYGLQDMNDDLSASISSEEGSQQEPVIRCGTIRQIEVCGNLHSAGPTFSTNDR